MWHSRASRRFEHWRLDCLSCLLRLSLVVANPSVCCAAVVVPRGVVPGGGSVGGQEMSLGGDCVAVAYGGCMTLFTGSCAMSRRCRYSSSQQYSGPHS